MPWVIKILNTINPTYVHFAIQVKTYKDTWDQLGECGDYLASYLEIGDNFVVNDEEGNQILCYNVSSKYTRNFLEIFMYRVPFKCERGTMLKIRS